MKNNAKRFTLGVITCMIALIMAISVFPVAIFAENSESSTEYVYITISDEGQFVCDSYGVPMAYRAVELSSLTAIDLDKYGLSEYKYDADGDGKYEITALHLFIYVHENILGFSFEDVDCSNGFPASMYFSSGIFGYEDENLRYDYNGKYPADEYGWGFTVDRIVLKAGDYLDVAHYTDWQFYYDSAYGFNYFATEDDEVVHKLTAEVGDTVKTKLILVGGGLGMGSMITPQLGFTIYYGNSVGNPMGTLETDDDGFVTFTVPTAGTWYLWCDGGEGVDMSFGSIVSSPACLMITAVGATVVPQDVSDIIYATMAQMTKTVTEPAFGTNAGEWTVLCVARGGYLEKDNEYFTAYYDRIVKYVNSTVASINKNGALHKSKSTDNSRLIVALSAIGKDATSVGDWNLITPYNDFTWVKKQGINGVIWTLIALDSHGYQTQDDTIRTQCINYILNAELPDGGWALSGKNLDVDITGMTLQALANYKDIPEVSAAAERAFSRLSSAQLENGGFRYGSSETSESAAQVIVALSAWGINPDTDERFIKNGCSVIDNLLSYYIEDEAMFAHQGTESNNMATDQACYALIAYDRLINGKTALYDYSDVAFETPVPATHNYAATVTAPTCENAGYTTYTCSTCPNVYTADTVEATGHDYSSIVTDPTCTENGYTTHTCSKCNATYTDSEVTALGHTEGEWVIEKEAEIGVAGSKYKPCATCGTKLDTASIDPLPDQNPSEPNGDGTSDVDTEEKNDTWVTVGIIAASLACTIAAHAIFGKRGHKN